MVDLVAQGAVVFGPGSVLDWEIDSLAAYWNLMPAITR